MGASYVGFWTCGGIVLRLGRADCCVGCVHTWMDECVVMTKKLMWQLLNSNAVICVMVNDNNFGPQFTLGHVYYSNIYCIL